AVLRLAEPQAVQRALDPVLDRVAAAVLEALRQLAVALHALLPIGRAGVGQSMLQLADLLLHGGEMCKRCLHLLPERARAAKARLLRQVGRAPTPRDLRTALCRLLDAGDDPQQRALARAVDADERDLLAARDLEA